MKWGTATTAAWLGVIATVAGLPGAYGLIHYGDPAVPYKLIVANVITIRPTPEPQSGTTPALPPAVDSSPAPVAPPAAAQAIAMQKLSAEEGLAVQLLDLRPEEAGSRVMAGHLTLLGMGSPLKPFVMVDQGWPRGWIVEGDHAGGCRVEQVRQLQPLYPQDLNTKKDQIPVLSKGQSMNVGFRAACDRAVQLPDHFTVTAVISLLSSKDSLDYQATPVTFQGSIAAN